MLAATSSPRAQRTYNRYDVYLNGRRYDSVTVEGFRSTFDIKRDLISKGHPQDIEVRLVRPIKRRNFW